MTRIRSSLALARPLFAATHPLPSVAVTAFVVALAISAGVGDGRTALLGLAILLGQFSVGWSNDAIDADRDRVAGRLDKPVAAGAVRRDLVLRLATTALVVDVPLSLAVGWRAGAAHLIAVGFAWHYNLWLKATPLSFIAYAVSFGLVPVIVATALPGAPAPRPILVGVAVCCGIAAHFANTVGDAADDAATGVAGLPQRIGETGSVALAAVTVCAAAGLLTAAVSGSVVIVAASAAAVAAALVTLGVLLSAGLRSAAAPRPGGRRLAFRAVLVSAGLLVVGLVGAGAHSFTA